MPYQDAPHGVNIKVVGSEFVYVLVYKGQVAILQLKIWIKSR